MSSRTTHTGFTLMEVVVAMVIVSVLMAALYAAFRTAWIAERSGSEAIERMQAAGHTMRLLRRDLLGAVTPETQLGGRWTAELDADGSLRSFSFNTNTAFVEIDYAGLTDADAAGGAESRWPIQPIGSEVHQVTWSLQRDNATQAATLVRGSTRNVLATEEPNPAQRPILRDVRGLWIRYYDGQQWHEQWESETEGNQLPLAVELVLELDDSGARSPAAARADAATASEIGRRFTTVVHLPMTAMEAEVGASQ